jgi:hypothetical protein
VVEVAARFLDHVEEFYRRPDGTPTSEVANYKTCGYQKPYLP